MDSISAIESRFDFSATVTALTDVIADLGMTLFATIDHRAAATSAGLDMPPTKVLLFGSPTNGTPLMLKAPELALELPLRLLVRDASDGTTVVQYGSMRAGLSAAGLPESALEALDKVLARVANAIAQPAPA